jgi:hypothetical protein
MWFRVLAVCLVGASVVVVSCSKQSIGQLCSLDYGDSDCSPGLLCKSKGTTGSYCCPNSVVGDIPEQCRDLALTSDAGQLPATSDASPDAPLPGVNDATLSDAADANADADR